ncbi:hypothetical protein Tco_1460296 [Tanacetum coccineum]
MLLFTGVTVHKKKIILMVSHDQQWYMDTGATSRLSSHTELGASIRRHTGSYYPKIYWELLPKEILGATTQRDTGSYYPKRYCDVLWENEGNLGNNISG